jgi:hypothetical protein
MDGDDARVEVERKLGAPKRPKHSHIVDATIRRFVASYTEYQHNASIGSFKVEMRAVRIPLKARAFSRLSIYIENSFRCSGKTS